MRSEDINHDRRHLGTVVMTGDENVELPRHAPNSPNDTGFYPNHERAPQSATATAAPACAR
jgi:hypothetical protein